MDASCSASVPSTRSTSGLVKTTCRGVVLNLADVVLTSPDVVLNSADVVLTSPRVVPTTPDVVLNTAEVVLTSPRVVLTKPDVVLNTAAVVLNTADVVPNIPAIVRPPFLLERTMAVSELSSFVKVSTYTPLARLGVLVLEAGSVIPQNDGKEVSMPAHRLSAVTVLLAVVCATPLFAQSAITITKSFNPSTVTVGGTATTTMTVTITNPNAFQVTGINFSDTYPAGLAPDQVGAYTCGTLGSSAAFNASGWAFTNVTLAAGASCSVPMLMHATISGAIVNTTSQVTGTGVPAGGPASATLNAVAAVPAPTLSEWMLLLFAGALSVIAVIRMRTLTSG